MVLVGLGVDARAGRMVNYLRPRSLIAKSLSSPLPFCSTPLYTDRSLSFGRCMFDRDGFEEGWN